jgi:DNA-binding response OmpR family regulator
MRILVIDDDEWVARAVQRRLREHEVTIETTPTNALGLVETAERQQQPFDAVVCDVCMPGASGPGVLATLRAREDPPMLILMSGYDKVVAAALVADAVLVKPFSTRHRRGVRADQGAACTHHNTSPSAPAAGVLAPVVI